MVGLVGPKVIEAVVTKVTDEAMDSVWRQIGYVRNYKSNIRDLENQLAKLKAEKDGMLRCEEEARRKGEAIEDTVTIWLKSADDAIQAADYLLREHGSANKSCFMGCCPNLITRHQFSRKAKKETTPALAKVQQDRSSIHRVSYPMDVQQLEPLKNYEALGSRMEIVEEILGALKSSDVNLIGVYGFPGVGKSTLVKQQVVAHVKEKNIFKVVAVANVTLSCDLSKIQQEIADWLGLDFGVGSTEVRAARLFARLKQEEKVLIILDDLWGTIPLEKIGIPPSRNDHEGCKIIMTSRDLNILLKMGVQKHFKLEVVQEDEAWQLFKTKAGDLRNSRIQSIATEVAKRCLGLPVVIVAVATSLRDKELYEWNDAFEQLKKFDHSEMDAQVYSALELSYKFLGDDAKSLLLLYALLPGCMFFTDLVKLGVGLDLFRNCSSVEAVRNRLFKVVNDLKKSCFLLEDGHNLYVRIHDVVHSFTRLIASKEHNFFTKTELEEWPEELTSERCTAISLHNCKIPKLPQVLDCPELESFLLVSACPSLRISEKFFSRAKNLKLVACLGVNLLPVLPLSLGFLEGLQVLRFADCVLEDISAIGELKKLRVLDLSGCNIVQLPKEIRKLTRLRFLDLTGCRRLKVVPPGILNCLTKLEELCMLGCLVHWAIEGDIGKGNNASLSELNNLPNLINVEIHIMNAKMMPADLFHKKLERFKIFIGDDWYVYVYIPSKLLKLKLNTDDELERAKVLLAGTEHLHLDDVKGVRSVLPQLERRCFPELKELLVQSCYDMEFIIDNKMVGDIITFPSLEQLVLHNLNKLKGICSGQLITSSFGNLTKLTVGNCNALRYLFSFSVFRCLIQLQLLDVGHCEHLEMIVGYEDGDEIIKLTQLTKLILQDLPMLVSFFSPTTNSGYGEISSADESQSFFTKKIQFPNLVELKLSSVKVKKIWNDQCIEFCPFEKLRNLIVHECGDLAYVLTSLMVRSTAQLTIIEICDCKSMIEVISAHVETDEELVLPNLNYLKLKGLPKVVKFCTSSLIRCPSLVLLWVLSCPRLHTFVSSNHVGTSGEAIQQDSTLFDTKVEFPNLENLEISVGTGLKAIWNDELHENSFRELRYFRVENAKEVEKIFPSNWGLKRFQNLEVLGVKGCDALREVFQMGALGGDDAANTQLRQLMLTNLPNLKHVWEEDPEGYANFLKLSVVHIQNCLSLKTVFPASVAKGLLHLQDLAILDSGIEQIVAVDGEGPEAASVFKFPMLKFLTLRRLPQLKSFCSATSPMEWPDLLKLCITRCNKFQRSIFSQEKIIPNLEHLALDGKEINMICEGKPPKSIFCKLKVVELDFSNDNWNYFPFDVLHKFDNLEKLVVAYGLFEELFPTEGLAGDEKHQMIFTKIRSLELFWIPYLKTIWSEVLQTLESLSVEGCGSLTILAPWSASFICLTTLKVYECRGLLSLMTSSTVKSLVQLKTLVVMNCYQLRFIVSDAGDETMDEITFIQLKFLILEGLPSLASFCSENRRFEFPCLIDIVVTQCPNMEFFSKGVSTTPLLRSVRLTENSREWLGDLNSTIRFFYRKC